MSKAHPLQTNFTQGELSPRILGRPDIQQYFGGAQELQNFTVYPQGGITRRMGSRFAGEVQLHAKKVRLQEFVFSKDQAYILEFGETYLRVYKDGALLTDGTSTTYGAGGITQASPAVLTYVGADDWADGDHVVITGETGMVEVNNRVFKVQNLNTGANTFELVDPSGTTVDSSGFFAATGGTISRVLEVTTPWDEAEVFELKFAQSADILYIVHEDYAPRQLSRTSETSWTLTEFDFKNGPYGPVNGDGTKRMQLVHWTDKQTISGISQADPGVVTLSSAMSDLGEGDWVLVSGVAGMTQVNRNIYRVSNISGATFELQDTDGNDIDTTGFTAYSSGGYVVRLSSWVRTKATSNLFTTTITSPDWLFEYPRFDSALGQFGLARVLEEILSDTDDAYVEPFDNILFTAEGTRVQLSSIAGSPIYMKSNFADTFGAESVGYWVRADEAYGGSGPFSTPGDGLWGRVYAVGGIAGWDVQVHYFDYGFMPPNWFRKLTYSYPAEIISVPEPTLRGRLEADFAGAFSTTDVGRWVRLQYPGNIVHCKIVEYISDQIVQVTLEEGGRPESAAQTSQTGLQLPDNAGRTDLWSMGAWHSGLTNGRGNWPTLVTFFEQRLVFASSSDYPQTLWFSATGDYGNFATTDRDGNVLDDSAIVREIASNRINAIEWIVPGTILLVGTSASEWQIKSGSPTVEPLTPTNFTATQQEAYGSESRIIPVRLGSSVIYVERGGKRVRELFYDFEQNGYITRELTILSEHILRKGGKTDEMAYQRTPHNLVWFVLTDGTLVSLTFNKEQQILAWARHSLGTPTGEISEVESLATVFDETSGQDIVYLAVKRTLFASTFRYIEYLAPDFHPSSSTDIDGMTYLDAHLVYDGSPATTISGLKYLEGIDLTVVADGVQLSGTKVPDSHGQITLSNAASYIVIGFPYKSKVKMMPAEGGSQLGSALAKIKRNYTALIRLADTLALQFGNDNEGFVDYTKFTDATLLTDDIKVHPRMSWDRREALALQTEKGYPLTVIAVLRQINTEDE